MRPGRDQWAMTIAFETAKRSTCLRRHVGAVLLSERGFLLATGYNGVSCGQPHCNEELNIELMNAEVRSLGMIPDSRVPLVQYPNACAGAKAPPGQGLDLCEAIHAEQNAMLQCKDVWEIDTCYTTASPCVTCVKLLLNTSCKRIVFAEEYPHPQARTYWEKAGRLWVKEVL